MGEDAQAKERIDAKNGLESYAYNMKNQINDDKFKDALEEADKKAVEDKVNEVMTWLDTAEHAEKEEFESMQKELESVCKSSKSSTRTLVVPLTWVLASQVPVVMPLLHLRAVLDPPLRRSINCHLIVECNKQTFPLITA